MPRPRKNNTNLPKNLYAKKDKRTNRTYYTYRDPLTGRSLGMGSDQASAILEARQRNLRTEPIQKSLKAGAWLENGVPLVRSGVVDEHGLFEHGTIAGAAHSIRPVCGVYFLTLDGKIVYVGQSKDVLMRLSSHLREGTKTFDSFAVVETTPENLNDLEAKYIAKFDPLYNQMRPQIKSVG